jgi:hypothetical protein
LATPPHVASANADLLSERPPRQVVANEPLLSDAMVALVRQALAAGQLARRDVLRAVSNTLYEPECLRLDMVQWLADTGLTEAMGEAARPLSPCPFSRADLREADERNEIAVVVPAGLQREHLATAFDMQHWALGEPNVTSVRAAHDEWLLVSAQDDLSYLGDSCADGVATASGEGKSGLGLEEYVLFAQRYRYLTGKLPDRADWTWLPQSSYVSSLVLCGGFPAYNDLFVNVWPWTECQGGIGFRTARRFTPL